MKNKQNTINNNGFTLLELSIVLVVIGLLMGGVLSYQSYARKASINTMMNEKQFYSDAFNRFQSQYAAFPGDYSTASSSWSTASNGDGNGYVRATTSSPGNKAEWFYVFQHLALAGFIQGTYTGATTGGGGTYYAKIGTNVPGTAIDKVAFYFDGPDFTDTTLDGFVSGDTTFFDGQYTTVIVIAGLNDNATSMPNVAFLTPKEALQIDEKYDDGLPGKGAILTPISTALSNCASSAVAATATYSTSNEDKTCYLFAKVQ